MNEQASSEPQKTIKRKPIGFVATCQCGNVIGAMDYERADRREAGKTLSRWLKEGCTITPILEKNWSVTVQSCTCRTA